MPWLVLPPSSEEDEDSDTPGHNIRPGRSWLWIREEAVKDGNLELAKDLDWFVALVVMSREGNPYWQQIPYADVKKLRKSVKDYGRNSPYFKILLELTFTGHTLYRIIDISTIVVIY